MMFASRGKKALLASAEPVLLGYKKAVTDRPEDGGGDRDVALMFIGYTHYAITYLMTNRMMKANEIAPVIMHSALMVRKHAANHGLGNDYIENTMHMVKMAIETTNGSPVMWTEAYHRQLGDLVKVNEGTFMGCLAREAKAIASA